MEYLKSLISGAIGVSLLLFAGFFIFRFIRKLIRNDKLEHIWLKLLKRIVVPLILLLGLITMSITQPFDQLKELPVDLSIIQTIVFNIVISWLIVVAIKGIRLLVMAKYNLDSKDNLKARKIHTQLVVIERILIVLVILLAFAITLLSFPKIKQIGISLLASAGIAGIIIGFAAQKSISMILAGFQIAITQPIRLDDVVIVESEWGWIEEITLTYVVIRIWDKRRLIVPITYFIEKPFQNWTRTSAEILGTVFIYVDYGFPLEEMRSELSRILENAEEWDKKVNVLQVTNATEHTIELRALVSAADSPSAWDLRVKVREELIRFVQQKYPQFLPKTRIHLQEQEKTK